MPTARWSLGLAAAGDKLYAIGGGNPSALAAVEEFDPVADAWRVRAPMPTARRGLGVAAVAGRVYAIGGNVEGIPVATVEEFDPTADVWRTRRSMSTARTGVGVVASPSGRIYAIGGSDGNNYLPTVEEYDPQADSWTTREPLPQAGLATAAMAANGKIYALAIRTSGSTVMTFYEYDIERDEWSSRPAFPLSSIPVLVPLPSGSVVALGGTSLWMRVYRYDPAADRWRELMDASGSSYSQAAALGSNGRIYVVGGHSSTGYSHANAREGTLEPDVNTPLATPVASGTASITPSMSTTPSVTSLPTTTTTSSTPSVTPTHSPTATAGNQATATATATSAPTEAAVGPTGGTLNAGPVTVEVPPGAVANDVVFRFETIPHAADTGGYRSVGAFRLTANGGAVSTFNGLEVTIRFRYDPATLGGEDERRLVIHVVRGRFRGPLDTTVDVGSRTVRAVTTHFSDFEVRVPMQATSTPLPQATGTATPTPLPSPTPVARLYVPISPRSRTFDEGPFGFGSP